MWPNSYRVMWPRWPFLFIHDDTKLYRIKCWYPFTHMGIWWPGEQAYFFSLKTRFIQYNIYIFNIFSYLCHIKSVLIFFFCDYTSRLCDFWKLPGTGVYLGFRIVHTLVSVCNRVCTSVCSGENGAVFLC